MACTCCWCSSPVSDPACWFQYKKVTNVLFDLQTNMSRLCETPIPSKLRVRLVESNFQDRALQGSSCGKSLTRLHCSAQNIHHAVKLLNTISGSFFFAQRVGRHVLHLGGMAHKLGRVEHKRWLQVFQLRPTLSLLLLVREVPAKSPVDGATVRKSKALTHQAFQDAQILHIKPSRLSLRERWCNRRLSAHNHRFQKVRIEITHPNNILACDPRVVVSSKLPDAWSCVCSSADLHAKASDEEKHQHACTVGSTSMKKPMEVSRVMQVMFRMLTSKHGSVANTTLGVPHRWCTLGKKKGRATEDGDGTTHRTASAQTTEARREATSRDRDERGATRRVLARNADGPHGPRNSMLGSEVVGATLFRRETDCQKREKITKQRKGERQCPDLKRNTVQRKLGDNILFKTSGSCVLCLYVRRVPQYRPLLDYTAYLHVHCHHHVVQTTTSDHELGFHSQVSTPHHSSRPTPSP